MPPTSDSVKKAWAKSAASILKAHFENEAWWKRLPGGACTQSSDDIPCDSKIHTRAFDGGIVPHHYRGGHGWQPLRIYTARDAGMSVLRHTGNTGVGINSVKGVFATGGDTYRTRGGAGATGARTKVSPYWPERGDFDQSGARIRTQAELDQTRENFAYDAWARVNDESAELDWAAKIKCERSGGRRCKKEELSADTHYVVVNPWAKAQMVPAMHSYLFVCVVQEFRCTPLGGPTTPPDKPKKKRKANKLPKKPTPRAPTPPPIPPGSTTPDDEEEGDNRRDADEGMGETHDRGQRRDVGASRPELTVDWALYGRGGSVTWPDGRQSWQQAPWASAQQMFAGACAWPTCHGDSDAAQAHRPWDGLKRSGVAVHGRRGARLNAGTWFL